MEFKEIEVLAQKQAQMPERLDYFEMLAFQMLRGLYTTYQAKKIDLKHAAAEKRAIKKKLEEQQKLAKLEADILNRCSEAIKKSERLRIAINKAESAEEQRKLAIECISLITGDKMILENLRDS